MLPGSNQRLPAAAHELVEKALLDHDLAEAPADDARWVELYDELRRLVERDSNTSEASTLRDGDNQTADNDDEDDYRWAPSSSSCSDDDVEPTASASAAIDRDPRLKPVLPNHPLSQAVHGYISEALTNKRGALPKDVDADSWSPASLAALSMVVEEVARSQAKFHAQRTMFAKSPRNQVLAARRRGQKEA